MNLWNQIINKRKNTKQTITLCHRINISSHYISKTSWWKHFKYFTDTQFTKKKKTPQIPNSSAVTHRKRNRKIHLNSFYTWYSSLQLSNFSLYHLFYLFFYQHLQFWMEVGSHLFFGIYIYILILIPPCKYISGQINSLSSKSIFMSPVEFFGLEDW